MKNTTFKSFIVEIQIESLKFGRRKISVIALQGHLKH